MILECRRELEKLKALEALEAILAHPQPSTTKLSQVKRSAKVDESNLIDSVNNTHDATYYLA